MKSLSGVAFAACAVMGLNVASMMAQEAPKPGPEQALLKKFEGSWEVTMSFGGMESKGTAVYKLILGGFWLEEQFKGSIGGMAFEGRQLLGYDKNKKKYVSTWCDSMEPALMLMEGSLSDDGKTFTEHGEGFGMDGKPAKLKSVYQFKDKDSFLFTMYAVVDGKDQESFKITYKRK